MATIKAQVTQNNTRVIITKQSGTERVVSCLCCGCTIFPASCNITNPLPLATSYVYSVTYDADAEGEIYNARELTSTLVRQGNEPIIAPEPPFVCGQPGSVPCGAIGQCYWSGVFIGAQELDEGLFLFFNKENCRWEIQVSYSGTATAYRPTGEPSPVGIYTSTSPNFTNWLIS